MGLNIKFYLGEYVSPRKARWATEAIALAQGFQELGTEYFANIDYWKDPMTNQWLFKKAPEGFQADVNIFFGTSYFYHQPQTLNDIPTSKLNVLLERNDELVPYWQRQEYKALWNMDLVLATHYNADQTYPNPNVAPWQIGFTNRMLHYIDKYRNEPVKPAILDTYRLHHNIRNLSISGFSKALGAVYPTERKVTDGLKDEEVPLTGIDLAYWEMTGRRHNPDYYKLVNQYLLNYCYGGFYHPKPASQSLMAKLVRQFYKLRIKTRPINDPNANDNYYIYQWDSFRLWESLLGNSCPLFLDFEDWKFQLPVNPVNWEHYIGVKGLDFDSTARRIKETSPQDIARIAESGRQWTLDNYSPKAVAQRFIDTVNKHMHLAK